MNEIAYFRLDEDAAVWVAVRGNFDKASVKTPGVKTSGNICGWLWPGEYNA